MVVSSISLQFDQEYPLKSHAGKAYKMLTLFEMVAARYRNSTEDNESPKSIESKERTSKNDPSRNELVLFLQLLFYLSSRLHDIKISDFELLATFIFHRCTQSTKDSISVLGKDVQIECIQKWIWIVLKAMKWTLKFQPDEPTRIYKTQRPRPITMTRLKYFNLGTPSGFIKHPEALPVGNNTAIVPVSSHLKQTDCVTPAKVSGVLQSTDILFHLRNINCFSKSISNTKQQETSNILDDSHSKASTGSNTNSCTVVSSFQMMNRSASTYLQSTKTFGAAWNTCAFRHQQPSEPEKAHNIQESEPIDWRASALLNSATSKLFKWDLVAGPSQLLEVPQQVCCICKECVLQKKLFAQRRFAILSGCDHVFCVGCVKSLETSSGYNCESSISVSVFCSQCGTQSLMLATSSCWIAGKEKTEFFRKFLVSHVHTEVARRISDAKRWLFSPEDVSQKRGLHFDSMKTNFTVPRAAY